MQSVVFGSSGFLEHNFLWKPEERFSKLPSLIQKPVPRAGQEYVAVFDTVQPLRFLFNFLTSNQLPISNMGQVNT